MAQQRKHLVVVVGQKGIHNIWCSKKFKRKHLAVVVGRQGNHNIWCRKDLSCWASPLIQLPFGLSGVVLLRAKLASAWTASPLRARVVSIKNARSTGCDVSET